MKKDSFKTLRTTNWKLALPAFLAVSALMAQPGGAPGGGRMGFGPGHGPWLGGLPNLTNSTITGAPFSAVESTQSQRTLTNGTQTTQQQQSNVYRDSQGRVRIDTTLAVPANSSGQTQRTVSIIYDPVAGNVYRLNPQTMTALQSSIPQRTPPPAGASRPGTQQGSNQVQTQNLGTQTINGVAATGTQVTRTIPANTIGNAQPIQTVRVTWTSTALQIPVQVTVTDPRSGNTTMNLTNIVQAEPDASLFQVPSGYTVTNAAAMRGRFRGSRQPQPQQ